MQKMASTPLRAVRSPLLRWWLSLLHAVNRQFRFVKVKTATRPETCDLLGSTFYPEWFRGRGFPRSFARNRRLPVRSRPPTTGVIIIIFEEKENDAQKI